MEERDKYELLVREVSQQGEAIRMMEATLNKVADALTKIASLETHKELQMENFKELKETDKDIIKRLNALEASAPVTKLLVDQSAKRWAVIGSAVIAVVTAAIFAAIGISK